LLIRFVLLGQEPLSAQPVAPQVVQVQEKEADVLCWQLAIVSETTISDLEPYTFEKFHIFRLSELRCELAHGFQKHKLHQNVEYLAFTNKGVRRN